MNPPSPSPIIRDGGGCEHGACHRNVMNPHHDAAQDGAVSSTLRSQPDEEQQQRTTEDDDVLRIKIEILSDTMCPWCWVGKRNLEVALEEYNNHKNRHHHDDRTRRIRADVEWLPYFLDADLAEEGGTPVGEYYAKNYGDAQAGERMKPHLSRAGAAVGLDFTNYNHDVTRFRPTIRSHRLIHYVKTTRREKLDDMVEEIFHMFNVRSGHLNSIDHLVEAAGRVGLDREDVRSYLSTDQDEDDVFDLADEIRYLAEGVPTFIFTRLDRPDVTPLAFSGARPPDDFRRVFERLADLPPPSTTTDASSSSCTIT